MILLYLTISSNKNNIFLLKKYFSLCNRKGSATKYTENISFENLDPIAFLCGDSHI